MTDRFSEKDTDETELDLENLEAADPQDAPLIAEALADRLSRELDGTRGTDRDAPEDRS